MSEAETKKIYCRCSMTAEIFSLELLPITDSGEEYATASISGPVTAQKRIYLYTDFKLFSSFFKEIENEWRGWEGSKVIKSVETELSLEATHNGRGSIALKVVLSDEGHHADYKIWETKYTFWLDAGAPVHFS